MKNTFYLGLTLFSIVTLGSCGEDDPQKKGSSFVGVDQFGWFWYSNTFEPDGLGYAYSVNCAGPFNSTLMVKTNFAHVRLIKEKYNPID